MYSALILVLLLLFILFISVGGSWMKMFIGILFIGGILMLICYLCGVSFSSFGINLFLFFPLFNSVGEMESSDKLSIITPPIMPLFFFIIFILWSFSFFFLKKPLRGL